MVKFHDGATLFNFAGFSIFLEEKLGIKKVDIFPYDTVRPELKERIFGEAVLIERNVTIYLKDILKAMESIEKFVAGITFAKFRMDDMVSSAG